MTTALNENDTIIIVSLIQMLHKIFHFKNFVSLIVIIKLALLN